jgi:hypothetical protein
MLKSKLASLSNMTKVAESVWSITLTLIQNLHNKSKKIKICLGW